MKRVSDTFTLKGFKFLNIYINNRSANVCEKLTYTHRTLSASLSFTIAEALNDLTLAASTQLPDGLLQRG